MKKHILFLLFLSGICSLSSQEIVLTNIQDRHCTNLNGKWEYVIDPYNTGGMGGMPVYRDAIAIDKTDRVEYSFDVSRTLWVPGGWNIQREELTWFEGTVWYRKAFNIDKVVPGNRYFIHIGGANYLTTVACNGTIAGTHEGGFTPFTVEVTHLLKEGVNHLIVGVNSTRAADQIPAVVTDWFNHGGIIRDVNLVEMPSTFIGTYKLALDKTTLHRHTRILRGSMQLQGNDFPATAHIAIPELKVNQEISVNPDGTAEFMVNIRNLELWSPEHPRLYKVSFTAGRDSVTEAIGFRTIETSGKQILLNGEPVFLKGICLHDENPLRQDRANSEEDAELVLNWVQELGCNFIRLAHYPHQENILKMADQRGIMLWEELPLYWGIQWDNPAVLQKAREQYTELIDRDYNRAATIIWSIANETAATPSRNAFLGDLADYVRSLDSTRLLSAAIKKDQEIDGHPDSVYTYNDPLIAKLDVISFNEYLGWYGGLPEECRNKTFVTGMEKPVIVSEFGGGANEGYHADSLTRWSEEFQEYLYKESINMFDNIDQLAGMTPWILVDFRSPLRQLQGVQDGWNRKGLISEKGRRKKAFYVLQNYYQTR